MLKQCSAIIFVVQQPEYAQALMTCYQCLLPFFLSTLYALFFVFIFSSFSQIAHIHTNYIPYGHMQPVLLFFALCDYTDALHGLSFEIFFSKLFTLSP